MTQDYEVTHEVSDEELAEASVDHRAKREIAQRIAANRGITQKQAYDLIDQARTFWDALENLAFVDHYGGMEFTRIFPDLIEFIHREANPLAHPTEETH